MAQRNRKDFHTTASRLKKRIFSVGVEAFVINLCLAAATGKWLRNSRTNLWMPIEYPRNVRVLTMSLKLEMGNRRRCRGESVEIELKVL